jgi:hypothetical protein
MRENFAGDYIHIMYMETAKQDFNKDVKDFFKKKRGYVSNDGMITFYTLKDKITYDKCVDRSIG